MTVFAYLDGTQLATTRIRLKSNGDQGIGGLSANADGEMGQGAIMFEDTASDLTVTGWMAVAVNETDCTSAPRLFTGYVADYHYEHGQHYRLTPERDIDTTINDTNVLLGTPILKNGDSPNRPAETDAARVAWLLGIAPMANIHDLGFVSTDSILMDATNYLYSTPADVLNDVCGPRNYIFFTYWDQSAREIGLFVAPPTRNIFTSTLSFSNDPADITLVNGEPSGTCFPAYMDPTLTVDPSTVYCDIAYRCVGFAVEGHSQTTHDAFFASDDPGNAIPVVGHRGIVLESSRTGLVSTARAAVANLLLFYGSDRRTATFTTRLPSTKVGLLQAGMLVPLKFRHLPGLTTFTSWRVQTLTVAPTDGDPTHYDLEVTASLSGLAIPAGTGGGSTTPFPPSVPPGTTHDFFGTLTFNSDSVASSNGSESTLTTTANVPDYNFILGHTYQYDITFTLNAGTGGSNADYAAGFGFGIADAPDHNDLIDTLALHFDHSLDPFPPGGIWHDTGTAVIVPGQDGVQQFVAQCAAGDHVPKLTTVTFWLDDISSVSGGSQVPPGGSPILGEVVATGDGSTTSFTTDFNFAAGSLKVYVDLLDQTAGLVASDGVAKTFTLGFAPALGEQVTVDYIVAP